MSPSVKVIALPDPRIAVSTPAALVPAPKSPAAVKVRGWACADALSWSATRTPPTTSRAMATTVVMRRWDTDASGGSAPTGGRESKVGELAPVARRRLLTSLHGHRRALQAPLGVAEGVL